MENPISARRLLLLTTMALLSSSALARPKTDIVYMKNGDRVTCEVKRLEGGIMEIGLDYVDGSVLIDWEKVDRVESTYLFAVQLTDGSTFAGEVITPEALRSDPRSVTFLKFGAVEPVQVQQEDIARVTQASVSFWRRFNGGLTLGSQYSKGNSTTQYNVTSDLGYEESRWAAKVRYSSNLSSSTGADTATRNQVDFNGDRVAWRKNVFYAGSGGFLQSSVQGIESQLTVGGGLGIYLKNTPRRRITAIGGMAAARTHYSPSLQINEDQTIVGAYFASSLDIFRFKRTHLSVAASMLPALNDPGRIFARTNASYYLKLFRKLDLNFSFYGNWDNDPPPGLAKSDYGTSTGLSISFGNH